MATPRANSSQSNPSAAPTELAVLNATPAPATITAPDAPKFLQKYQAQIAPMERFQVVDNATDVTCQEAFNRVGQFIAEVEAAFKPAKSAAHTAHKAITALEGMFTGPAELVLTNLKNQHLAYARRCDELRRAEERRLQAEQEARARAEAEQLRQRLQAEADAEHQRQLSEIAELPPWEQPAEEPVLAVIEAVEPEPVPLIRLPSTVPVAIGAPSVRKLPWAAEVQDFKALVIWIGKQCAEGDDRFLELLLPNGVRLNQMARDHTTALKEILPGVVATQGETLKRG